MFSFFKKSSLSKSPKLQDDNYSVKVSFCISHMNREDAIKETLKKNLMDNEKDRHRVEFVLMDFNKNEQVYNWVKENLMEYIQDGYFKYFQCKELKAWHAPLAKNTSHKVGQGVILVNLDGDNFTGYRGGKFVLDHFNQSEKEIVLWQWSKIKRDGSFGRIALTQEMFFQLGGYNQEFMPMGYQDNDLIERAKTKGAQLIHKKNREYNKAIVNDKYIPPTMKYEKMRDKNKRISKKNIKKGILKANHESLGFDQISIMMRDGTMSQYTKIKEKQK